MQLSPVTVSLVSALTALVASIVGPIVTLTVARRQFQANVLSTNRQRWIDTFRDRLAQLVALLTTAMAEQERRRRQMEAPSTAVDDAALFTELVERIVLAYAQVSLLTKDDDATHQELLAKADSILALLRADQRQEQVVQAHILDLTRIGRNIIRYEWGCVKRGI